MLDIVAQPARCVGARRGPRQRDVKVKSLLDNAMALVLVKDVAAVTIDEIASRSGVAKGTFYHYFPSKACFWEALRDRHIANSAQQVREALAACPPNHWRARLDAWVATVAGNLHVYSALSSIIPLSGGQCGTRSVAHDELFIVLQQLLHDGMEDSAWVFTDCSTVAAFLLHGMYGLLDDAVIQDRDISDVTPVIAELFSSIVGIGAGTHGPPLSSLPSEASTRSKDVRRRGSAA